jgi:hypothetical protein
VDPSHCIKLGGECLAVCDDTKSFAYAYFAVKPLDDGYTCFKEFRQGKINTIKDMNEEDIYPSEEFRLVPIYSKFQDKKVLL